MLLFRETHTIIKRKNKHKIQYSWGQGDGPRSTLTASIGLLKLQFLNWVANSLVPFLSFKIYMSVCRVCIILNLWRTNIPATGQV